MYERDISQYLKAVSPKYPVITLIGPRQSGKSTLSRWLFPDYQYVSLEISDIRSLAQDDPRGFFKRFTGSLIIDEVQRVPDLLSFIQGLVDEPGFQDQYVLTGSHQILLMEKVTQSLAGRTVIAKLLPFSHRELRRGPTDQETSEEPLIDVDKFLFSGGYPRIYDKGLNPTQWLEQYYQTYVERDVRSLLNVSQIALFDRFVRLCAGRVGQLLNLSSLASDCGISVPTAGAWLSVLETSFICMRMQPHFRNFNKRLIKSPKLYFYDTGLLCYLLKIKEAGVLESHPLRGAIFENWVVSEYIKKYFNQGEEAPLYFWRDTKGHEVDLLIDEGTYLYPIEIKSAYTTHPGFFKGLQFFADLQGPNPNDKSQGDCIYSGADSFEWKNFQVRSWRDL